MPNSAHARAEAKSERRSSKRQRLVLRVGLLEADGRTALCLVKNVSSSGVQVKLYAPVAANSEVSLKVGDESPLSGRMVWVREELGGIRFTKALDPATLLRVTQKLASTKRRSSPRVNASARAILRTGGRTFTAELCDISASGAKLRTRRPIIPGQSLHLALPGMPTIRAHVRWVDEEEIGLSFATPIPIQIIAGWLSEDLHLS